MIKILYPTNYGQFARSHVARNQSHVAWKLVVVLPVAKDSCLKCEIFFALDTLKFSGVDESNLDGAHKGLSMEQLNQ